MTAMYSVTEPIGIEIAVIAVIAVICSAINGSTRQAAKLKHTVNGYQFTARVPNGYHQTR